MRVNIHLISVKLNVLAYMTDIVRSSLDKAHIQAPCLGHAKLEFC